jgi:hypothetical protein
MLTRPKKNTNPYKVIGDFFSFASMSQHRKFIYSMLEAAYSEDYWRKSYPGVVLLYQEQIEKLIKAIHKILREDKNNTNRRRVVLTDKKSVHHTIDPASYFGKHKGDAMWAFFPRHLSGKEFIDPYQALEKCFEFMSLKEWLLGLRELVFYALSPNGNESALDFDFLKINNLLQKLIEASHLILVRLAEDKP